MWFDYPMHVMDANNYLGVATYSDSGSSGRGTGKGQKQKTDWFETVEEMLSASIDSAVTLAAVGISEDNAKKKFTSGTDYEVATVNGLKVVHYRKEDQIDFDGMTYLRRKSGRTCKWVASTE